jgi:hypothetical protein
VVPVCGLSAAREQTRTGAVSREESERGMSATPAQRKARTAWNGWAPDRYSRAASVGVPCAFSWWAHFETPPELFYETAHARAQDMQPPISDRGQPT